MPIKKLINKGIVGNRRFPAFSWRVFEGAVSLMRVKRGIGERLGPESKWSW
jgi:hypothetical protein